VALPTVTDTLGVPPPAFLRKLRRKSHWGAANDPLDDRVDIAVREVFLTEAAPYSVYLIRSDQDLCRVAIGLNGNRDSLAEVLDVVAFRPSELQAVGITFQQTPGHTRCRFANLLHHDLTATETQLRHLCRTTMQQGRNAGRFSKGTMKEIVILAQKEQCVVALGVTPGCQVAECAS
jgi:hypothetical protein